MFLFVALTLGAVIPAAGFAQKIGGIDMADLAKQAASARQAIVSLPVADAEWPTIFVNGTEVPSIEAERVNIYLSGEAAILATKLSVAVDRELDRRKTAGEDITKYIITEEEVGRRIDDIRMRVETAYPDTTFEQYLAKSGQTIDSFKFSIATQARFDGVFLPVDNPWPDVTLRAVESMRPGLEAKEKANFLEQLKLANQQNDGKKANALAMLLLRQQIVKTIVDPLEFKDALDGLPQDTAVYVAGVNFKTKELFKKGMGLGGYLESLKSIQFSAIREAVRQAIIALEDADFEKLKAEAKQKREAGQDVKDPLRPVYWLKEGSAEFREAFDAEKKIYPPGPFDHKGVVRFRKFPTMQMYRYYFQMIESFKRATAAERTPEVLKKYVEESMLYFSNGTADVEAILYAYSSDPNARSVEEGYASAKERAEKGLKDLQHGAELADKARKEAKTKGASDADAERAATEAARGFTFSDILERDSDFKDPKPQPGAAAPMVTTNRGRFGPLYRNPLSSERLYESELTNLLSGYSFGEELFFRAPIGEVVGPVRGPNGYLIARVLSRANGGKVPDLADDKQMDLARQDYVNHAFQKFVNTIMQKAKIEMKW